MSKLKPTLKAIRWVHQLLRFVNLYTNENVLDHLK